MRDTEQQTDTQPPAAIQWDTTMPLLTDRFFLLDMFKIVFISLAILLVLVLTIGLIQNPSDIGDLLKALPVFGYVALGLLALVAFVCLVFYGNRFPCRFRVDHDGAAWEVTSRQRKLNTAVVILGALAGKPGTAGAGLMAKSQESQRYLWLQIHRVDLFPRQRVIALRNSWRTLMRIYCTPDNYEVVARTAVEGIERTARIRARQAAEDRKWRGRFLRDLGWALASLAFTILATACPLMEDHLSVIWVVGITGMLGSICGGPVRKGFGFIGFFIALGMIAIMAEEGLKTREIIIGLTRCSQFELVAAGPSRRFFIVGLTGMAGQVSLTLRNIATGRRPSRNSS